MSDVFLFDAVRTPFGRHGGALAKVRPDDLGATVLRALAERNDLDPSTVDEVYLGDANGAGEDNRNVARMATLLAGWPTSVPAGTLNRLCGSGLDAVMQASRTIQVGDASLIAAGGTESMSRAPLVMAKPEKAFSAANQTLYNSALGWRMVNPAMPEEYVISNGDSTEYLAQRYGLSREEQDEFSVRSHVNAARAWDEGFYNDHVVPVEGVELARDEGIRPDSSLEKLAKLKPAFKRDGGTVTAGNSSSLNDGAAALLLGDEAAGKRLGKAPLARIAGRGAAGVDPNVFGIGPVRAAEIALERAGIGWGDVAAVELNEAFAAQSLACLKEWKELDPALVNAQGGAIAIGHPLGASGGRILGTLAYRLRQTGGRYGVAAICIGVGQGLAVVIENQ